MVARMLEMVAADAFYSRKMKTRASTRAGHCEHESRQLRLYRAKRFERWPMRNSIELQVLPGQRPDFEKPVGPVSRDSPPELKVSLFRSLFRGRADVYPQRFQSRTTGKSGYQPACGNEWARGICEKPKIKCMECANSRFLPVTDEVVRRHLSGKNGDGKEFVMGVYPMLQDETCFFLAADFDKANWQEDVNAVLESCRNLNLPPTLSDARGVRSTGGVIDPAPWRVTRPGKSWCCDPNQP